MKYKNQDILNCSETVIAHGCNCQGVMNSGVAKSIRQHYPKAYRDYYEYHKTYGLKKGCIVYSWNNETLIVNLLTQENYGKGLQVDYKALRICLMKLERDLPQMNIFSFAMPMIGAGLGGGDWKIIESIIKESFQTIEPVIYYI